jgi:hypothetical protein
MNMPQNFTLYTIYALGQQRDDEPFDLTRLPLEVVEGVRIEDLRPLLKEDAFDYVTPQMGTWAVDHLKRSNYAFVHRYEAGHRIIDGELVQEHELMEESSILLRNLAECLRLIRPMRQITETIHGKVGADGSLDINGFDHPVNLLETPQNQKLFRMRNRDADDLLAYAPEFLRAMDGEFWKFRMATQFHLLGHFQHWDWKARYLLWSSAMESIYTSHSPEHKGSLVAKERIKWFLDGNTSLYPAGELSPYETDPNLKVADVVDRVYEVRNYLAHGDRLPDQYFQKGWRKGIDSQPLNVLEGLFEAINFIIRSSLLRILRDGLLDHFADATASEAYFGSLGLTRKALKKKLGLP